MGRKSARREHKQALAPLANAGSYSHRHLLVHGVAISVHSNCTGASSGCPHGGVGHKRPGRLYKQHPNLDCIPSTMRQSVPLQWHNTSLYFILPHQTCHWLGKRSVSPRTCKSRVAGVSLAVQILLQIGIKVTKSKLDRGNTAATE